MMSNAHNSIIEDYSAAARSIALNLGEFCDRSLPYYTMIATAARRASAEIEALRKKLEKVEAERDILAKENNNTCSLCANHIQCQSSPCGGCIENNFDDFVWRGKQCQ